MVCIYLHALKYKTIPHNKTTFSPDELHFYLVIHMILTLQPLFSCHDHGLTNNCQY